MELVYDFKGFNGVFQPSRRNSARMVAAPGEAESGPIHLVHDAGRLVAVYAEGEDLVAWVGRPLDEFAQKFAHRELVKFGRESLDQWIAESLDKPHAYDQGLCLREKARAAVAAGAPGLAGLRLADDHFFLAALRSREAKFLPNAFGVFLRLEGQPGQDLFMIFRRGRLDFFHEPDLTGILAERRREPREIVRFLQEKHLLPVQGVFAPYGDWVAWSGLPRPWRTIRKAIKTEQVKLFPYRWDLRMGLWLHSIFR